MAGELTLTAIGNLTADPELRQVGGANVANFTVAHTTRSFDKNANAWVDGSTTFIRCSAWRDLAEHVAGSLGKGDRVIVTGRFSQRDYEDRDGNKRTSCELEVDEVGPSLRYATAAVQRVQTNRNQQARREQYAQQQGHGGQQYGEQPYQPGTNAGRPQQQPQQQSWGGYDDETPF